MRSLIHYLILRQKTRSNSKFKPTATTTTSEISSSSSLTTSKISTATKPNTATFAVISKKSELPPTKTAKFREPPDLFNGLKTPIEMMPSLLHYFQTVYLEE